MKILIQWATAVANDWQEYSTGQLPNPKAVPDDAALLDDFPGWITAINVQGVIIAAWDHYNIQDDGTACKITVWSDDEADGTVDNMLWQAREYIFRPVSPDPNYGGAWNTNQTFRQILWSEFTLPTEGDTYHGKWLPDATYAQSKAIRSYHGWREWTEGVPEDQIANGKVIDQRAAGNWERPKGTRTYFQSNTDYAFAATGAINTSRILSINELNWLDQRLFIGEIQEKTDSRTLLWSSINTLVQFKTKELPFDYYLTQTQFGITLDIRKDGRFFGTFSSDVHSSVKDLFDQVVIISRDDRRLKTAFSSLWGALP